MRGLILSQKKKMYEAKSEKETTTENETDNEA